MTAEALETAKESNLPPATLKALEEAGLSLHPGMRVRRKGRGRAAKVRGTLLRVYLVSTYGREKWVALHQKYVYIPPRTELRATVRWDRSLTGFPRLSDGKSDFTGRLLASALVPVEES